MSLSDRLELHLSSRQPANVKLENLNRHDALIICRLTSV